MAQLGTFIQASRALRSTFIQTSMAQSNSFIQASMVSQAPSFRHQGLTKHLHSGIKGQTLEKRRYTLPLPLRESHLAKIIILALSGKFLFLISIY